VGSALLSAWRIGVAHALAYRAEVAIRLGSACLVVGLNGTLWSEAAGDRALGGIGPGALLAYVVAAWASVQCVASALHADVAARLRDGSIAADLVRPMDLPAFAWARDAGRASAQLLVGALPVYAFGVVALGAALPAGARCLPWLVSLVLAHAVNVQVSLLLGVLAAWTRQPVGITQLKGAVTAVLSGALVPLPLMPGALRAVAEALPFSAMAHAPAAILSGAAPGELLLRQIGWLVVTAIVARVAWSRALRRITVEGG
jgi:ABC-2 type transport system permease protein